MIQRRFGQKKIIVGQSDFMITNAFRKSADKSQISLIHNNSYDEALKPKNISINTKRNIKTARSSRMEKIKQTQFQKVDSKRPRILLKNPQFDQSVRAQKLGLQDFYFNKISKTISKQSKRQLIQDIKPQKSLNQKFQSHFLGKIKHEGQRQNSLKVDWENLSEQKETKHISQHLFPCRKHSGLIRGRFFSNSPIKAQYSLPKRLDINSLFPKQSQQMIKKILNKSNKPYLQISGNKKYKVDNIRKISTMRKNTPIAMDQYLIDLLLKPIK